MTQQRLNINTVLLKLQVNDECEDHDAIAQQQT